MSSMRKRQALYGYAPGSNPITQTTTCTDPITGRQVSIPAGATYNNGGNMKFGLYPTVGKSVGFLNLPTVAMATTFMELLSIPECSTA